MADATPLQDPTDSNPERETDSIDPKPQPDPSTSTEPTPPQPPSAPSSSIPPSNANPSTPPPPSLISPPSIQPYPAPSFRPATPPAPVPGAAPQFSPIPSPGLQQAPNYQTPGIPPPGVSSVSPVMIAPPPGAPAAGAGVQMGYVQPPFAMPGQPLRPYAPIPNGYPGMPHPLPQGGAPPPGIPRYPSPYPMVRQMYPPRPPIGVGIVPPLMRPPVPVIRGLIIPPVIRPAPSPLVTQTEKTHITVYVGKISPTVENDFMLSLLQLCGPVKSWKRVQDPTNGTLKGFGLCEFESAEGVLRALRLLSKLSIDGQELMLNVNQATKGYLEQYVKKKIESSTKPKDQEDTGGADKGEENVSDAEKSEASKTASEHPEPTPEDSNKDNEKENKENHDTSTFGLVTDEDRQADQEASEKLTDMIKERLKNKPLPPPPPPPQLLPTDAGGNLSVENHSRSKDGESDADAVKNEVKNEDDLTSESKPSSEHDREGTSSPDRRRHDRSSRDRDRDIKREKERELERYEREREQERAKREKEREYKIREDERRYKVREKEWESREREKEHWRKREREREKERAHERKLEIMEQEHDGDDGYKRRKYRSSDEERKRRHREKEDDLADRLKEEEEIAEAKQRDDEQQQKKEQEEALRILSGHVANGHDRAVSPEKNNREDKSVVITSDLNLSHSEALAHNSIGDESMWAATAASDTRQNSNAPAKKLGFGLQGSGKRAAVPSVFNEDEDEDMQKEKKMRPLVPIDYSTEEQPVVHPSISEAPSLNSTTAIETAKRISNVNSKEDRLDAEKDRSRRSHERSSHRERERHDEESRKENVDHDRARDHRPDKARTPDNQKLLDAKQLIDMIPKTKNELFSYEINWAIYDKNELHERMRPWIAKKITEFLGEEEPTLVDYIVSSTQEHVKATEMLERLQAILDEEAEMFVLKMWRMLIFEIKKVETGLASRSKS